MPVLKRLPGPVEPVDAGDHLADREEPAGGEVDHAAEVARHGVAGAADVEFLLHEELGLVFDGRFRVADVGDASGERDFVNGGAESLREPDGLDHDVRASAAGEFGERLVEVGFRGVDGVGRAELAGEREFFGVDVDPEKLALAREFGATDTIDSSKTDLHQALADLTGGRGPNVVIEAVGLPQTFRAAVDEVAFAGSVTYIGYAKAPVEYETKLFVQKELDIRGSRNAMPCNFRRVIDFAARGLFPIGKTISRVYGFEQAGQALQDWHEAPAKVCRYLLSLD